MKLTIGMIVKNEEKWLEKCLTAIKPILDNVDSELIITDTGSTDRTVQIAKQFTDKILHFEWCSDFSAARNTALDVADGEWFMFLDADEIFKSCDGIIDFFNSGEYNRYRSAAYSIRNLAANGTGSDFWARRMTRIEHGTRFESAIHEHLNTFGEPVKYIADIADHYGYIYQSDADKQKKFDRNYKLLKSKFDAVKDSNPMVYSELYDMLATVDRQKEADEYMEAGIRLCVKLEHPLIILLYCKKARHLLFEQQNKVALDICDKYFSLSGRIRNGRIYSDAEMYAIKATALYRSQNFVDAAETLILFFDTFNDIKEGRLDTKDKMYGSISLADDSNYTTYVGQFLDCCLRTGQLEKAAKYMSELSVGKYSEDRDTLDGVIALELMLLEHVGAGYLDAFAGQLDDYGKQKLLNGAKAELPERTQPENIKLTIGMIVKNEEKWLEKCLTAIKPILDNVDSELIITDTGSVDRTVEIAKRFTDKVLHFEWCDDFSVARNFGLKEAKGEWFMMLDADDIFCSCDHIIEFFNSGEYKNYNSAAYVSRNLLKSGEQIHGDEFYVLRMTRLLPQTKYVGIVHEYLSTLAPPYKNLSDIADHYGYLYENEEARQRKFKRNTDLLLKMLEKEKDTNTMLYVQLYQSYMTVNDEASALKYIDLGIKTAIRVRDYGMIALYYHKMVHFYNKKDYDTMLGVSAEYFSQKRVISSKELTADGEVYALISGALYRMKRYAEAIDAFGKFFELYGKIRSGEISTYDEYLISLNMCTDINFLPAVNEFLECCIRSDRYDTAAVFLKDFPAHKYSFEISEVTKYVKNVIAISSENKFRNCSEYYTRLNDVGKTIFADELFHRLEDNENQEEVFAALSGIADGDERLSRKSDIYRRYYAGNDVSGEIRALIVKYGAARDVDLIMMAMKLRYDISYVFGSPDTDIKRAAYSCCKGLNGFYDAAGDYDIDYFRNEEKRSELAEFYRYIMETALLSDDDKRHIPKLMKRFADFGNNSGTGILKAASLVGSAIRLRENRQYKDCVTEIKRAIATYEPLAAVLSEYSRLVLDEYEKAAQPQNEMQVLAAAIKKNIRAQIASGDLNTARKTLNDYAAINPGDEEIPELLKLIGQ